jgi:hypothetical protein
MAKLSDHLAMYSNPAGGIASQATAATYARPDGSPGHGTLRRFARAAPERGT